MNVRQRGAIAWAGKAMLLAALLLGIVTMHTLGHPSSEAPSRSPDAVAVQHHQSPEPDQQEHGHGDGMDPASVCLAVLGVWSAAALLGAYVFLVVRHRRAVDFFAAVRARILLALRPLPPPPMADRLAALSVLRI